VLFLDVNLCLHGLYHDASPAAEAVTSWLDLALGGDEQVAISEQVLSSMIRIGTNPRVYPVPTSVDDAVRFAEALLSAPASVRVRPGPRHWALFTALVTHHGLRGNAVADAFLAAMAMELGAVMATRDRGFKRFGGLRILDPLA